VQLTLGLDDSATRLVVLGSGSGGNALVLESGGRRLMVDAGFSCREIEKRLARVGLDGDGFDGLILTHEHSDHTRGVKRFAQRHRVPVYATAGTLEGAGLSGNGIETRVLLSGRAAAVGDFILEPFAIPHDAREPIGVVMQDAAGRRIGLVADLGARSQVAWGRLTDLDALILESNHDLDMLRNGPYPWPLKQRVASRHGHLSNREAAEGIPELDSSHLQWVVLYHLSRTNNLPALAMDAVGEALSREGSPAEICVAHQFEPSPWMEIVAR
jgi:phosphoribosyl 1,2-cyclic phosphodiesterase